MFHRNKIILPTPFQVKIFPYFKKLLKGNLYVTNKPMDVMVVGNCPLLQGLSCKAYQLPRDWYFLELRFSPNFILDGQHSIDIGMGRKRQGHGRDLREGKEETRGTKKVIAVLGLLFIWGRKGWCDRFHLTGAWAKWP